MDVSFTYFNHHEACYIDDNHSGGEYIENTESIEKDVSFVSIQLAMSNIHAKYSRIESWTHISNDVRRLFQSGRIETLP